MFLEASLVYLGYVFLGVFYVINGALHFQRFSELTGTLSAKRIPMPGPVLAVGSIFQIIAGLMLALQAYTHFSALGLAVFTLMASLMLLDFWRMEGPARRAAIGTWQTNLALIGALMVIGFQ